MRAVIDIGSNSILLLIAERAPGSRVPSIVCDVAEVARLSEGAARSGRLRADAIARALKTLAGHVAHAEGLGLARADIVAVATEGLRMVENPDDFLVPAAELLGRPIRLLSGDEEARLSYLSVALEHGDDEWLRVLDIGGASTELVSGRGRSPISVHSHALGSVRMSERFVTAHPPDPRALAEMEAAIREALARQPLRPLAELHGVAGTVTACGALVLGLGRDDRDRLDGCRISIARVRALRDELATWPLARLSAHEVLGPGRADLIVAGATILLVALEHCGATTLVVRERGLRHALL